MKIRDTSSDSDCIKPIINMQVITLITKIQQQFTEKKKKKKKTLVHKGQGHNHHHYQQPPITLHSHTHTQTNPQMHFSQKRKK